MVGLDSGLECRQTNVKLIYVYLIILNFGIHFKTQCFCFVRLSSPPSHVFGGTG
jgi:hypothetical protein